MAVSIYICQLCSSTALPNNSFLPFVQGRTTHRIAKLFPIKHSGVSRLPLVSYVILWNNIAFSNYICKLCSSNTLPFLPTAETTPTARPGRQPVCRCICSQTSSCNVNILSLNVYVLQDGSTFLHVYPQVCCCKLCEGLRSRVG